MIDTGLTGRIVVTPVGEALLISGVGNCVIVRPFQGEFRLMVFDRSQVKEKK